MAKKSVKGKFGATFRSYTGAIEEMTINFCPVVCPFGQPGDRLWVREAWCPPHDNVHIDGGAGKLCWYRAEEGYVAKKKPTHFDWRRSVHMPRWAARLILEVTEVRVERLQEITAGDVLREGIRTTVDLGDPYIIDQFAERWDELDAKPRPVKEGGVVTHYVSYRWEDIQEEREHRGLPHYVHGNPWVWVVEYKTTSITSTKRTTQ